MIQAKMGTVWKVQRSPCSDLARDWGQQAWPGHRPISLCTGGPGSWNSGTSRAGLGAGQAMAPLPGALGPQH